MAITGFADDELGWDHDTVRPGIVVFGNAIQVWSVAQGRATRVGEAAAVFCCEEAMVRAAVEDHDWMDLVGDLIVHDGA